MPDDNKKKASQVSIPVFMVGILVISLIGYGEVKGRTLNNEKNISDLKQTPIKIAGLETEVKNLSKSIGTVSGDMKEFMKEQRGMNIQILAKLN